MARIHGSDMESWYRHGLMVQTWTHVIEKDSWYRHGIDKTSGIELDGRELVRTRGPNVVRMRDFLAPKGSNTCNRGS